MFTRAAGTLPLLQWLADWYFRCVSCSKNEQTLFFCASTAKSATCHAVQLNRCKHRFHTLCLKAAFDSSSSVSEALDRVTAHQTKPHNAARDSCDNWRSRGSVAVESGTLKNVCQWNHKSYLWLFCSGSQTGGKLPLGGNMRFFRG